jgi:hypothetical protein
MQLCVLDALRSLPMPPGAPEAEAEGTVQSSRFHGDGLSFHTLALACGCHLQVVLEGSRWADGIAHLAALAPLFPHNVVRVVGTMVSATAAPARPPRAPPAPRCAAAAPAPPPPPGAPLPPSLYASGGALLRVACAPAAGGALAVLRALRAWAVGALPGAEAARALACGGGELDALGALLRAAEAPGAERSAHLALRAAALRRSAALAGVALVGPRHRGPHRDGRRLARLAALEAAAPCWPVEVVGGGPVALAWGDCGAAPEAHPAHNLPAGDALVGEDGEDEGAEGRQEKEEDGDEREDKEKEEKEEEDEGRLEAWVGATVGAVGGGGTGAGAEPVGRCCSGGDGVGGDGDGGAAVRCRRRTGGLTTRLQYAHLKKTPQILWFLHALRRLLPQLRRGGGGGPVRVVDVGGGRGDLGIAVASAFGAARVRVAVVDANEPSLAAGEARAAALGLAHCMDFFATDVRVGFACGAEAGHGGGAGAAAALLRGGELFVGLHTCGGLTDAALALAAARGAAFLVVPCCFTKHAALAAAAGGGWREHLPGAGEADERAMCMLAESPARAVSLRAMRLIAGARLRGAAARAAIAGAPQMRLQLLHAFDDACSLRNLALVGSPEGV